MQSHRTGETPHGVRIRTEEERARQEFQELVDKYGGTPPGDAARAAMGQTIPNRNPLMTPEETADIANEIFPTAMGNVGGGLTSAAGSGLTAARTGRSIYSTIAEHAADGGKLTASRMGFNQIGIINEAQLARHVESVMRPGASPVRFLARGRVAYWHAESGTVVIAEPALGHKLINGIPFFSEA